MANDYYIPDDDQSYLQAQIEQENQEYELFINEQKKLKEQHHETDSTSIMQSTKRVFTSIKDSNEPPF